ncbi:putative transcriptional regulatory protein [Granulibacter bethesdensis]|uniref:Transcriptional regulatory protein n=2 Tax=Granulibacter bethesdensis TaxID=364410 RepID=Q0BV66_GRABC|nr:putative transcriptional regulatory protein [Granulibacter bethesdensis CGDNIH1]AHJ67399.1 putative transcriptional regulatory protein [Granulibacter bethesdensis]APH51072.1 putative transcriptional regulatory protein [Granulibacter bethesdensis]APH63766.1 putative transcriptional regulatory protein [Granulibacter bethesdensis]
MHQYEPYPISIPARTSETMTMLDVTADICPMTFVRTRIALDKLPSGALLSVLTAGDEASRNVPQSAAALGHEIIAIEHPQPGQTRILIRRQ